MKGVVSCDKPRVAANKRKSGDSRMGKPNLSNVRLSPAEYIGGRKTTEGTETSYYLQEKKTTRFPE
jgi:hypothetical protein